MSKYRVIRVGDSQPVDCPSCGSREGYHIIDQVKTSKISRFNSTGFLAEFKLDENNSKTIYRSASCFCNRCDSKLPIKLKRRSIE